MRGAKSWTQPLEDHSSELCLLQSRHAHMSFVLVSAILCAGFSMRMMLVQSITFACMHLVCRCWPNAKEGCAAHMKHVLA